MLCASLKVKPMQEFLLRVPHYISVLEAEVNSIRCHGPMATAGETDVCSDAVNLETQFSQRRALWQGPFLSYPTAEGVQQFTLSLLSFKA